MLWKFEEFKQQQSVALFYQGKAYQPNYHNCACIVLHEELNLNLRFIEAPYLHATNHFIAIKSDHPNLFKKTYIKANQYVNISHLSPSEYEGLNAASNLDGTF